MSLGKRDQNSFAVRVRAMIASFAEVSPDRRLGCDFSHDLYPRDSLACMKLAGCKNPQTLDCRCAHFDIRHLCVYYFLIPTFLPAANRRLRVLSATVSDRPDNRPSCRAVRRLRILFPALRRSTKEL